MLLNRSWHESWDFAPGDIGVAEEVLASLYAAAGKPHESAAATDEVLAALLDDLDVPRAVGVAIDQGGAAARLLVETLKLH